MSKQEKKRLTEIKMEYEELQRTLSAIKYICTGSVMVLFRKCGKKSCSCQNDKDSEHGPYYVWTRKVEGKTVTRALSSQQAEQCMEYIENLREIEPVLDRMKILSAELIELETGEKVAPKSIF